MATIGESLKASEDQQRRERIARRSDMLRKFVKEDLLTALQDSIAKGGTDYAPVLPPQELRPLFAAPLDREVASPYASKRSAYYDVWRELDEWAAGEDLFIRTGHNMTPDNYVRPWADYDWGGSLGIREKPKVVPVKPTPPPPQMVSRGVPVSVLVVGTIAVILAFILLAVGAFK